MEKKALLIKPGYAKLPKHEHLEPGTSTDIINMKKNLVEKFSFKDSDIKILEDDEASKDKIKEALENFEQEVKDNSLVFLYYTGHGMYLPDSQDEGLLPTVTSWPPEVPLEEVCVRGNDFLKFLDKLAKKKVKVFLLFDCCHSGQMYRVAELKGESRIRPRQVVVRGTTTYASTKKKYSKADRRGWTPEDKDCFTSIAACSSAEVSLGNDDGGYLTQAFNNVINAYNLKDLENLSYEAFFRLIKREFKKHSEWRTHQSPQIEGANLDTVLFGTSKVTAKPGGIIIKDVLNENQVVLDAGVLQNLSAGEYDVFETTASEDSSKEGFNSEHWLGAIDVNEDSIGSVEAYGTIKRRAGNKEITIGCLAYLEKPGSIKNNVFINVPLNDPEVSELCKHLKATNMFNILERQPSKDIPDPITITIEEFNQAREQCWVARCDGNMVVPQIWLAHGNVMAGNLDRYIRYKMALDTLKKMEERQNKKDPAVNASLKVFKVEKVKKYDLSIIEEALKGTDILQVSDQRTTFKTHSIVKGEYGKGVPGTGDGFVFQVCNNNSKPKDTDKEVKEDQVHVCVFIFQFNGAIKPIYPKNKGNTIPLIRGNTAEDIFRLCIPKESLRTMAQPDPTKDEPNYGDNTLVMYATSSPVDFGPLQQTRIKTNSDLNVKSRTAERDSLTDLEKFLSVNKRCIDDDDLKEDTKFYIKTVNLRVEK